jgi:hypothetical protein
MLYGHLVSLVLKKKKKAREFSLLHNAQTGSGAHSPLYSMDRGFFHPGYKDGA